MPSRILSLFIPLALCLFLANSAFAQNAAVSLTGDTEILGNLNILGNGKGIKFPDGTVQNSAGQKGYVRTLVVSPAATEAESGSALRSALSSISDAGPCSFEGFTYSVWNAAEYNLYLGASKLDGPVAGGGLWKCAGYYDRDYSELKNDCRP